MRENDSVLSITEDSAAIKLHFHLNFLTAGLNGKEGLIRQHFSKVAKVKENIANILRTQIPYGFITINKSVRVTYIRYCSLFMDWDNACASFKHIGDAMQDAGIIVDDDSQHILVEFLPKQIKCKRTEQRTEIIIEYI